MRREDLIVYREELLTLDVMSPATLAEMWLQDLVRTKMQASAWLILHYKSLHDGHWPEMRPEEIPTHGGAYRHGPQEIPAIWAAEISVRVKECGDHGQLLWRYYGDNDETWTPAPEQHSYINSALAYCSGWRRKPWYYPEWRRRSYRYSLIAKPQRENAEGDAEG